MFTGKIIRLIYLTLWASMIVEVRKKRLVRSGIGWPSQFWPVPAGILTGKLGCFVLISFCERDVSGFPARNE